MADHGAPSDALVSSLNPQNIHRRRRSEQDSSSKPSLTSLGDDLLMEILQRLRTAKDVFLCSSVCKNWYDIIFSPCFISRFVTYHANCVARKNDNSGDLDGFESSISIVMRNLDNRSEAIILPENPLSKFQTLDFTSFCEEIRCVWILASCHELLLCIARFEQGYRFVICNPLTMKGFFVSVRKWMDAFLGSKLFYFAFVFEPYCSRDSQGGCILNPGFRYRMLRVVLDDGLCDAIEIYCSERGEFIEDYLFIEESQKKVCSNLVVYNGKVHWFNGKSIVAYDPFRVRIDGIKEDNIEADALGDRCFIIKCLDCFSSSACYNLGVCRGLLRLMRAEFDVILSIETLTVWDLEDYEQGKWSVERKFRHYSLIPDDHPLSETLEESLDHFRVVAPHPCDENLVYLSFNSGIVTLCKLEGEVLNVVTEFSHHGLQLADGDVTFHRIGHPIVIPWWPTPISSLQQQNTQQEETCFSFGF